MHGTNPVTKHFIKLYLLLLVTIAGTAWTVDAIYFYFQQEQYIRSTVKQTENYQPLLAHYALKINSNTTTNEVILPPGFSHIPQQALAWPNALLTKLNQGQVVSLTDSMGHISYYLAIKKSNSVIMLTLNNQNYDDGHSTIFWLLLFYSAIALVVWLWVSPLVKDIYRLQKAAIRLGQGEQYKPIDLSKNSMLAPTSAAFNEMAGRIGNLLGLQQDINSAVSHDIRTPLARIKFSLAGITTDNLIENKDSIIEDINEIDDLVNEILLYAKLEHASPLLDIRQQNLHDMVSQIINKYQTMTNIQFYIKIDPELEASFDKRSFTRALQNLLDNSIRFAKKEIHIGVKVIDKQNVLTLEDDGPGIPKDMLNKITQPFVGASKKESASEGFGLGLFIVKKICLWHNGYLHVDNTSAFGGAKFELNWPNQIKLS